MSARPVLYFLFTTFGEGGIATAPAYHLNLHQFAVRRYYDVAIPRRFFFEMLMRYHFLCIGHTTNEGCSFFKLAGEVGNQKVS